MAGALTLQTAIGGGFSVTVSPSELSNSGSGTVTTSPTTATPVGGSAPYNYLWTAGNGISADSPTSQITTFSATPDPAQELSVVAVCFVTDNLGQTASGSATVTISGLL